MKGDGAFARLVLAVLVVTFATGTPSVAQEPETSRPLLADRKRELIAFAQGLDESAIRAMRPNGTGVRTLVPASFGVGSPRWLPDGRLLAYVDSRLGTPDIFVLDVEAGKTRRLPLSRSRGEGDPEWSPDGRWLVYGRDRSLNVISADGKRRRRLTRSPSEDYGPAWSPNGRLIAFAREGPEDGSAVFVVSPRGGQPRALTDDKSRNREPAWSPEGRQTIVFTSDRDEFSVQRLYLMRADGSDERRLIDVPGIANPSWSPDGRWIIFTCEMLPPDEPREIPEETHEIYAVRPDGTSFTRITKNQVPDAEPDWVRLRARVRANRSG